MMHIDRLLDRLQGMSAANALRFVASRLFRYDVHVVFHHDLLDIVPPVWDAEDHVLLLWNMDDLSGTIVCDLIKASPGNKPYIDDIRNGIAIGLVVYRNHALAHFAFIMKGSRTLDILGFDSRTALLGNDNTAPTFRGRGLQTRSVRARLIAARVAGFKDAVSETAPGNDASQKAMKRAGLSCLGTIRFVVILNRFLFRYAPCSGRAFTFKVL